MSRYLSPNKEKELVETAAALMTKGKGLLAADESTSERKIY
jgi:fructose-bisphosphate aldolase class 1